MRRSKVAWLVVVAALAVARPAAAAASRTEVLERHVMRLAAEERSRGGDRKAEEYILAWLAARIEGSRFDEVPLGPEAFGANADLVRDYEGLAEALRRAEHWEAGDPAARARHPLAAANLVLARYHLSKGRLAPRRRVVDLLRTATPNVCRMDFPPIPAPPPPPPPPPPPTARISVDPPSILRGEEATLEWSTENAETARIDGEGVAPAGARQVRPEASRAYVLVAEGPGGKATAMAGIEVREPPPPFRHRIHFDFDRSNIRSDAEDTIALVADAMLRNPALRVRVEGHTDAKGTDEYNQGLSERRAQAAAQYLTARFGIEVGRLEIVGGGEREPIAPNETPDGADSPDGRARNRRVEFVEIR